MFPYTTSCHPYGPSEGGSGSVSHIVGGTPKVATKDDVALSLPPKKTLIQREQMFMYAVKHGHLSTVEELLADGLSANMLVISLLRVHEHTLGPDA